MLQRIFPHSLIAALAGILSFWLCMFIYEPIARIFLGIAVCSVDFFFLCWFDKYVLTNIDLYEEIVQKQNVALAILVASFVVVLCVGSFIAGGG